MKKNNLNFIKEKNKKKYLSFLIIFIALIISLTIINNSKKTTKKILIQETKKSENINYNININKNSTPNITQKFLNQSFIELVKANQLNNKLEKKQLEKINNQNIEKIISDIIEKENTKITKNEINILNNTSKEEEIFYIILIKNIINTQMLEMKNLDIDINKYQNIENYFKNIYKILDETFILLKNINTPEFWIPEHLELLNFFNKHRKIFEAFSKSKEDPLNLLIYSYKIFEIEDPLKEYQEITNKIINKFQKTYYYEKQ